MSKARPEYPGRALAWSSGSDGFEQRCERLDDGAPQKTFPAGQPIAGGNDDPDVLVSRVDFDGLYRVSGVVRVRE